MKNDSHQYRDMFNRIRKIINALDPSGLDPGSDQGTPVDEYDAEAAKIVSFVLKNRDAIKRDRNLLADQINTIWQDSFSESCSVVVQLSDEIAKGL